MNITSTLITTATLSILANSAIADQRPTNVSSRDVYTTIYDRVEVIDRRCELIDVPIYETRQVHGNNNAGGNALLGMIIGGTAGKVITGNNNGAAAGAVIGGVIAADQSRTRTENVIVGYRKEKSCTDDVSYQEKPKKVYSHSILMFTIDGKQYKINYNK